jgi:FkbM family methyltransferase
VRHLPALEKAEWIWRALRKPYHWIIDVRGHGVIVKVANVVSARIPAEFSGYQYEAYERQSITRAAAWFRGNAGSFFLDVGASLGIYCLVALAESDECEAVALDSDLSSLIATQRLTAFYPDRSPMLIWGLVGSSHTIGTSLGDAAAHSRKALLESGASGDLATLKYVCIADSTDATIPEHSLDGLLDCVDLCGRPVLIKCDVEGAELLVLHGSMNLLRTLRPHLFLSVHPDALTRCGHSVRDISEFLENLGYSISVIARDHEEHWWCEHKLQTNSANHGA